jgi:glucan phosphoethanolaminetransferase (alkaline phosphatase superfamily)
MVMSLAYINYFCRAFGIDRWLIAVHLPLVLGLLAVSFLTPGLGLFSRPVRDRRSAKYFLVLLPAVVTSALLILYLADLASNVWIGSNITYKLVGLWASDWWSGGDLLSLSPWIYISAIALAAAVLGVLLALSQSIFDGLSELLLPDRAGSLFTGRRRYTSALAIAVVVAGYAIYLHELSWRTPRSELLSSDPILAFLRTTIDVYDDSYLASAAKLKQEEPRVRAAYPRQQQFDKKNVIVITVDSLRADHTQLYGYGRPTTPFLAGLLASGRLRKVEFATSTCAETNCGILSTLFSKTLRHQIPEDFKLYDLLHDQGYQTYFILSARHDLVGLRQMYGYEQTFYFDGRDSQRYATTDDRVILEGLERVPSYHSPAFFYFHLMSVHLTGVKQDRYRRYQPSAMKNDWDALFSGEYDRQTVTNNYDNGVVQADATIKDLFAALDQKGYLQNSLVVILADHGEGLGERGQANYGHVSSLYQEFIRIPLLIYDDSPFQYANLRFATQIDVAPTIVDRLGLKVPNSWEGTSLLDPNIKILTVHQTMLRTPCYALVYRQDARMYKYIDCFLARREELYDLTVDPGERVNLRATADPSLMGYLRRELSRIRSE